MSAPVGDGEGMSLLAASLGIQPAPIPLLRARSIPHPERAMQRGELIRVRRGVYAPAMLWRALAPWERYLARVHAVAQMYPGAVLSHESASVLWGGPVFGDPQTVHVLVGPHDTSRWGGGVRAHRSTADRILVEAEGVVLTSIADTAVDLARHRHPAAALASADHALRIDELLSADSLLGVNEARASSRGRRRARWALSRATHLAETTLESVSRAVIEWLGFPAPTLQAMFRASNGHGDRADFFWPDADLVGEADGDLKYDGRFGDPTDVLRRQSQRDHRMREHVRAIAHWGWTDAVTVGPLRSILRSGGLQPVVPENTAELAALRQHLFRESATARRESG